MICEVVRVWPGEKRTTVIARDEADGREKSCYVWLDTAKGALVAALCERIEKTPQRVVLTVKPKHRHFGYEIEDAELVPEAAA